MLIKASKNKYEDISRFVNMDCARNYFIIMGLLKDKVVYKDVYIQEEDGEIVAALFHRMSDNLQFCAYGGYDVNGFKKLIQSLDFNYLISPRSYCKELESVLSVKKEGAFISCLEKEKYRKFDLKFPTRKLSVNDLDDVLSIYKSVSSGYPNKEFMVNKLQSGRGRGVVIGDNEKILSVSQTELETDESCVVVGVATDLNEQHKGYASSCLTTLVGELLDEGKMIYLQYDNPEAGKIYERIGFEVIDQVFHYTKG